MAFLIFGVHEPDAIPAGKDKVDKPGFSLRMTDLAQMGSSFWFITIIGALFALARFSVAFLALRAMDLGLPIGLSPFVLVLMSVVFSLSSYPVGLYRAALLAGARVRHADPRRIAVSQRY